VIIRVMSRITPTLALALTSFVVMLPVAPTPAGAQEVWTGTDLFFEKPAFADWTQPAYQDSITEAVRITRKSLEGIFNIAQEGGYERFVSPVDTEWATGSAADWQSLVFKPWDSWIEIPALYLVGREAVVHLISDDIYLDIRFESWSIGPNGGGTGGGGFSYVRASGPETPVESSSWGAIKARMQPDEESPTP
jgi:hypothetical protein